MATFPAGGAGVFLLSVRRYGQSSVPEDAGAVPASPRRWKGDSRTSTGGTRWRCRPTSAGEPAFNLLDARGVIAVTERRSYILRVRDGEACGAAWLETAGGGADPVDHVHIRGATRRGARFPPRSAPSARARHFPGYWLYLGQVPVIPSPPRGRGQNGWVNHVASGYDFEGRPPSSGPPAYQTQMLPDSDIRQIFVNGPEGIRIELQCPPADA
jgi:hypothetical protein